jgi:iron complex outermembrane receptor protein
MEGNRMYSHRFSVAAATNIFRASLLALLFTTAAGSSTWAESGANTSAGNNAAAPEDSPIACSTVNAQVRKLAGVVTDQTGAGIAHAQLTLTCGNFRTSTSTGVDGAYSFSVPAGAYRLLVEATGFGNTSQDVTIMNTGVGTELNPVLTVGLIRSMVTVTSNYEYVTTVSSGGTKTELPLAEVPQAITVINRQLMDSQNAVKLDDALKNVAGVIPGAYYDGYDFYRIRGFEAVGNTYVDGLRGGGSASLMEETWGIDSIEVMKGPSSALYGQGVLGGLVNLVTRKPEQENFAHVQFTGGSFNFMDPAIDVNRVLNHKKTLYGRLDSLYHWGDSFVDYAYRHRYYIAPSLTWRPDPSTMLTLQGRFQRDNERASMPLPAYGLVLPNPNGDLRISTYIGELGNDNKVAQPSRQFGYQFRHDFNRNLTLRENARFAWYEEHWNHLWYPSYLASDYRTLYRYAFIWDESWQSHDVDTNIEGRASFWKMDHDVLFGVDFYRNPADEAGSYSDSEPLDIYNPVYGANPDPTYYFYEDAKAVTQYLGIYLQDHIVLPRHFTVTAGGRVDFAKSESFDNRSGVGSPNQNNIGITPRVGLTWQGIPSTTIYASFSKSFLPQAAGETTASGSYLPPERGRQWEGGVKSSLWGERVMATLALFQLDRFNVATSDPSSPSYYVVTGQQRSRGTELEATLHPLTGWNITTAYSFVNAIVTEDYSIPVGTPTLNSPKNIFNIWSTYEVPRGVLRGLSVSIGGRHYSDQAGDSDNTFQLPAYGIMDGSLSYRCGHAKWQVNANNLADKRYAGGSYNDLYVKPGEPRTVRATFAWSF